MGGLQSRDLRRWRRAGLPSGACSQSAYSRTGSANNTPNEPHYIRWMGSKFHGPWHRVVHAHHAHRTESAILRSRQFSRRYVTSGLARGREARSGPGAPARRVASSPLLGRELGMFARRPPGDEDNPPMLRVMVDKPPDETREQWIARRSREFGVAPAALVLGSSTRFTNGRDSG
jgi:hypothetical protein